MPDIETVAVLLFAGLAAGWLAGLVTRGSGLGGLGNMLLALAGACGAVYVTGWIGLLPPGHVAGGLISGLLGAFGLLYLVASFRR
jgi:uncharacterized membrane protein YeaQ/YmgE (transglycosylase-associated protein family)